MATETSQAWRVHLNKTGTVTADAIAENLVLETIPKPQARDGQVTVRVKAVALNYRDLLVATNDPRYLSPTVPPLVPLVDGAGVVASAPAGSRWRAGDRVLLAGNATWRSAVPGTAGDLDAAQIVGAGAVPGFAQQYYVAEADDALLPAPAGLSHEEVACLGVTFGTAWNALYGAQVPLRAGDVVVAQGTGGVSMAVLQIATAAGAKVIMLSSSDEKLETAKQFGAVHGLRSDDPHWDDKVREYTGGRGADHVVDVIGGASILQSLRAVRQGGLVTLVGFLSASEKHDLIPDILFGAKTVRGIIYASIPMLTDMCAFVEKHNIKPVISHTFEWTEVKDAYLALLNLKTAGKIVVKVD